MITMAPISSKIASDSKKILRDEGTLLPKNSNIAKEKAVSVAVGIAQPFSAKSSPILHKKNINEGIRIPPNAAIAGKAIFLGFDRNRNRDFR